MKTLIIGAGPVGLALAEYLTGQNHEVTVLTRSPRAPVRGVTFVRGDVLNKESGVYFDRKDLIFHTANAPYHLWPRDLPRLWQAIVGHSKGKTGRLVAASNLYVYGHPQGPMSESHPWLAKTRKGLVRREVEGMLLESGLSGSMETCIVRGSDFYGPARIESALGDRFFSALFAGKAPEFTGSADTLHSYTFIGDFARTLAAVGTASNLHKREWIVPNDRPVTGMEITGILSNLLNRPLKAKVMGRAMLTIGGIFVPAAKEIIEMLYEFEAPFVATGDDARETFGIVPTPLEEGLRKTLEWYHAQERKES